MPSMRELLSLGTTSDDRTAQPPAATLSKAHVTALRRSSKTWGAICNGSVHIRRHVPDELPFIFILTYSVWDTLQQVDRTWSKAMRCRGPACALVSALMTGMWRWLWGCVCVRICKRVPACCICAQKTQWKQQHARGEGPARYDQTVLLYPQCHTLTIPARQLEARQGSHM